MYNTYIDSYVNKLNHLNTVVYVVNNLVKFLIMLHTYVTDIVRPLTPMHSKLL